MSSPTTTPVTTPTTSGPNPVTPTRCFGDGDDLYEQYHDTEWGVPVHGDPELLERLALEGFQSGLSWLTVLRKRPAFREAFAGFDPETVAAFTPQDVDRLLLDASIIRNRAKIRSVVTNARAVVALHAQGRTLDELVWSHAPVAHGRARHAMWMDVPASSPESVALAKDLKAHGFTFVGPITAYATMQACGLVDDHLEGCPVARRATP